MFWEKKIKYYSVPITNDNIKGESEIYRNIN